MTKKLIFSIFIFQFFISCGSEKIKADIIFINGVIWTANDNLQEVEAMAIKLDTIMAVGTTAEIEKMKGKFTQVIDLKNKFITPGFIDAHVHLLMGGNSLLSVQLRDVKSPQEFSKKIKEFASSIKPNEWIVEGNWDHTLWGGELPSKEWIDSFTQKNPVAIYRMDGHMILANSAALKIAGIDRDTPDVENGEIVKNSKGEPTGILKSEAMYLVLNKIPALSNSQKEKAIKVAQEYLLSQGVTSIHDVDSLGGFKVLKKIHSNDELKIRVYSADPLHKWEALSKKEKINNQWLKNGLLKGFVDGSLGSHSAAFLEPYSDKPKDSGILTANIDSLQTWIQKAANNNLQVTVHAIGDKANHVLLNAYEKIIRTNNSKDRRFRIEHAQHLSNKDISRFSDLKIIASMQPYHAIDDGRWAEEVIGANRIKTTYAFKSLIDAGATLAFGSDWPVAPASPLLGIYAAVTRQTLDNKNSEGWVPTQKINVEQALLAYTKNAAYSAFNENIKGSLEVGKLADFVILSEDIRKIKPVNIKNIKILNTYVGGEKVYENKIN